METLNYREIVKNFIQKYAQEECVEDSENIELVFDTERSLSQLLQPGNVSNYGIFISLLLTTYQV